MRHRLMTHPLFLYLLLLPLAFYPPHTLYKQPLVTRKPPLNPNHRKTRLLLIEKIAKFAEKY